MPIIDRISIVETLCNNRIQCSHVSNLRALQRNIIRNMPASKRILADIGDLLPCKIVAQGSYEGQDHSVSPLISSLP